ncbi:MAG: type IX secretion system membrane protein PorP/SprF [Tannerellaceae bacterium]|jgi:type IX secretion system PorP/SprF family membrane protein|nr:type IX secretion system membrane protein PorP/SprF [Tannerellaceae bacterium]
MKRLFLLIIVLTACMTGVVRAQYDAQLSQYFMAMGYYNPAYAGTTGDLNAFALHRQQWIGIKGAPKSFFVTGDMPLKVGKSTVGIGLNLFTERIGLFQNTNVAGQLAYKQKLFGGTLSIGLQLGLANISFDGTKVYIPESDYHEKEDEAIPTSEVNGMGLDMNGGLYYTHTHFYIGMASTHVLEPELELDENISTYIGRAYNLTAGYNIQLKNPLYELQPSVFMKTDIQSFQADITARLVYNKMFNGGVSWRVNESVIVMLGVVFGNIQAGYAYDFPTTPILKGSSGSHELMIRFKVKLNKMKTGQYKHKSVRIL